MRLNNTVEIALLPSHPLGLNGSPHCTAGRSRTCIWHYIAAESQSIEVADRFIDSIVDRFLLLAQNPRIGRRRDEELRPGLRSFPVGEYIIVYRIESEEALILHVVRGSRNLEALLG